MQPDPFRHDGARFGGGVYLAFLFSAWKEDGEFAVAQDDAFLGSDTLGGERVAEDGIGVRRGIPVRDLIIDALLGLEA